MTPKIKIPTIIPLCDYVRLRSRDKLYDFNPFDGTLPSFITGPTSQEPEPEWWRRNNEVHAMHGRLPHREFYFKGMVYSRKRGAYMKAFVSMGRSNQEAHDGLKKALGMDATQYLVDIDFNEYKTMIRGNNAPPGSDDASNCPWHDKPEKPEKEYDKYEDLEDELEEPNYEDQL